MNMNVPIPLMKIVESIADDLPKEEGQAFSDAVNVAVWGKDLSLAHWVFLGEELRVLPDDLPDHIQAMVDRVIAGMDRLAAGKEWPEAAKAVRICDDIAMDSTTEYAACAASYAAEAAAKVNVTSAAYAAAYAAEAAADYASYMDGYTGGYTDARRRQRDKFLELVKSAPDE